MEGKKNRIEPMHSSSWSHKAWEGELNQNLGLPSANNLGVNLTRKNRGCERYKEIFRKNWAQVATSREGKKKKGKDEIPKFNLDNKLQQVANFYRGSPNFFAFPLFLPLTKFGYVEDRQPTYILP